MKIKPLIILLVLFFFAPSCIDPLYFNKGGDSNSLVVDGWITTEPGPYIVYLARTSLYNSYYINTEEVKGAIITISDNAGIAEILSESYIPGIYETDPDGIRGIPGRYYKIEIETTDGKHYESTQELLRSVPDIDTVYYERQQIQEVDDNNLVQTFEGFQIFIDTSDPENEKNYYMWTWIGTHEVHTQPWNYFDVRKMRPAPKDCCSTCWVNERSSQINVFDDMLLGGNQIRERPITFVRLFNPKGSRHYRGKYHVEVKQLSLTREAYNYWSSIREQIVSSGSIFEPPPFAIIGNMTNTSNAEDPVFGYFGASSISKKDIFIPASEAPFPMYDTLIWSDDCRALSNSTPYKPSFW